MRRSHEGPEVLPPQDGPARSDKYFQHIQHPPSDDNEKAYLSQSKYTIEPVPSRWKRRKWWVLGMIAVLVMAVVIGGVVGGTAGRRKAGSR